MEYSARLAIAFSIVFHVRGVEKKKITTLKITVLPQTLGIRTSGLLQFRINQLINSTEPCPS
jgi:hypothetical protein